MQTRLFTLLHLAHGGPIVSESTDSRPEEGTMPDLQTKRTNELAAGDVVLHAGMRLLIDRDVTASTAYDDRPVWHVDARVLNLDEVQERRHVPVSWLERVDGVHRWRIQGNELASWYVELEPEPGRRMAGYVRPGEVFVAPDSGLHVLVESNEPAPFGMVELVGRDETGDLRHVTLESEELVELPLRARVSA